MNDYEKIHFHVFNPKDSIFRSSAKDKAQSFYVECNNSENCSLYVKKQCACRTMTGNCPYGKQYTKEGFTSRARNFYEWIRTEKQKNQNVGTLESPPCKFSVVGDYIYIPYSFVNMNKNVPFESRSAFGSSGALFLKKEHFTVDAIISMIKFRPQALFGGEITSYQTEVVPKICKHVSEVFPELWAETIAKEPLIADKLVSYTNVKRKAKLNTLVPDVGNFNGWTWNGKFLTKKGGNSIGTPLANYNAVEETIIVPAHDAIVKITDDEQVDENTEFVD